MNNQYVIKHIKKNKWLDLDYHDGTELIFVDKFTDGYKFKTDKEALKFLSSHNLSVTDCELYQLRVFIEQKYWNENV